MNLDHFQDLACRALETPDDLALQHKVADALRAHPEWQSTWAELSALYAETADALAAHAALEPANSSEETLPAERLPKLLTAAGVASAPDKATVPLATTSRASFPRWTFPRWAWAGLAAAAMVTVAAVFWPRATLTSPLSAHWNERGPESLRLALTLPLPELPGALRLPVFREETSVRLQSPLIAAQAGPVIIAWTQTTPGQARVRLVQNDRVIWETSARSPVTTPALPADAVYSVEILPSGQPEAKQLSETFVTVVPVGPPPAGKSLEAVLASATAKPPRVGEAFLAYQALTPAERNSEAGQRVGLWLAVEARQPELFQAIQTRLAR